MKVALIIGFVIAFCAFAKSDPTCAYSTIDTKYTCVMTNSVVGTATNINGAHIGSNTNDNVLRVITADVADNAVIKLVISKFANLEAISIQNGEFTAIAKTDFPSSCTKLKQLQISKGTFTSIVSGVFTDCSIEEYDLSNNKITKIEKGAFTSSTIKKLILANNKIDVTSSPTGTIFESGLYPNLVYFDISANEISSIPATLPFPSNAITHLDLSKNTLTDFPETQFTDINKIEKLYFSGNGLTEIKESSLLKLTALKELKLGTNQITGAKLNAKAFDKNTNLELLDLSVNPLATLDAAVFTGLTKLKSFDIHNTQLTNTSAAAIKTILDALVTLEYIDIGSNVIGPIEGILTKNVNLKHLNISSMNLESFTDVTLNTNTKLETLTFNSNKIKEFPEKFFEKTTEMRQIHGKNNEIVKLKTSTFEKMTKLEVLDFTSNKIDAIERNFFEKFTNLKVVKFSGNTCIKEDFLSFSLDDATKEKLKTCFDNYNGAGAIIISNILLAFVVALKFI